MANELQAFLRIKQVTQVTGLSRSWIYEAIRRGDFPSPILIGARAIAWTAHSIANWQANRIGSSGKPAKGGKS